MNKKNYKFEEGDIVKIQPEWTDSEDEIQTLFVITKNSIDREKGRCNIKPITGAASKLPLVPIGRAAFYMLKPTGFNFKDYVANNKKEQ